MKNNKTEVIEYASKRRREKETYSNISFEVAEKGWLRSDGVRYSTSDIQKMVTESDPTLKKNRPYNKGKSVTTTIAPVQQILENENIRLAKEILSSGIKNKSEIASLLLKDTF